MRIPNAIKAEYSFQKDCLQYRDTVIGELYTRNDYAILSSMLINLRGLSKYMVIAFEVSGADPENIIGSFTIKVSDTENVATGTGINLLDALFMANARLDALKEANKIQKVEISADTVFEQIIARAPLDASSIKI